MLCLFSFLRSISTSLACNRKKTGTSCFLYHPAIKIYLCLQIFFVFANQFWCILKVFLDVDVGILKVLLAIVRVMKCMIFPPMSIMMDGTSILVPWR